MMKLSIAWRIGTGQPLADLARVVHPVPLVGRMSAPGHHQLGTEEPPDAPRRHEHGSHDVQRPHGGELGTAASGEDQAGGDTEQQPAERRQSAVPHLEDLAGVGAVGGQVRHHVEQRGRRRSRQPRSRGRRR